MATIVSALKKLYGKLGGTETAGPSTIAGMVDKVADVAGGGGGGSEAIVTFGPIDKNQSTMGTIPCDMTLDEVSSMIDSGKSPIAKITINDGPESVVWFLGNASRTYMGDNLYSVSFYGGYATSVGIYVYALHMMPDGTQYYTYFYSISGSSF